MAVTAAKCTHKPALSTVTPVTRLPNAWQVLGIVDHPHFSKQCNFIFKCVTCFTLVMLYYNLLCNSIFSSTAISREANVAEKPRENETGVMPNYSLHHRTAIGEHSRRRHPRKHMTSSVISSDLEATSVCDTEMTNSRFSSASEATSQYSRHRQRKQRRRHKMPPISKASTISSITESSMSLNIVAVTLNLGELK